MQKRKKFELFILQMTYEVYGEAGLTLQELNTLKKAGLYQPKKQKGFFSASINADLPAEAVQSFNTERKPFTKKPGDSPTSIGPK